MEIKVALKNNPYKITFRNNQLDEVGNWLSQLWKPQKVAIITDKTVEALYAKKVSESLIAAGFSVYVYAIEPGEYSKSLAEAEKIYHWLAENGLTRSDGIVALGGGVVGDLAGFVASTYMRGLHFIQIPTTLLAQVDSSVGGKTAVNTEIAKNLVGSFSQPSGVFIDTVTLETLESRRIREGLAEIIKTAAILDAQLWKKLTTIHTIETFKKEATPIIARCCEIKAEVVVEDEYDNGKRLLLNFGHTIGHAIEATIGYGVVTHGEAVAMGMYQVTKVAEEKGYSPCGITKDLSKLIQQFDLATKPEVWDEEPLVKAIAFDKKKRGSLLNLITLDEIGKGTIRKIPVEEIKDFVKNS